MTTIKAETRARYRRRRRRHRYLANTCAAAAINHGCNQRSPVQSTAASAITTVVTFSSTLFTANVDVQ